MKEEKEAERQVCEAHCGTLLVLTLRLEAGPALIAIHAEEDTSAQGQKSCQGREGPV